MLACLSVCPRVMSYSLFAVSHAVVGPRFQWRCISCEYFGSRTELGSCWLIKLYQWAVMSGSRDCWHATRLGLWFAALTHLSSSSVEHRLSPKLSPQLSPKQPVEPNQQCAVKTCKCRAYNFDWTCVRRTFDCTTKVIKVTVTWPAIEPVLVILYYNDG